MGVDPQMQKITIFLETVIIPRSMKTLRLYIACDFVLQFNFTVEHIPGKLNTAAYFLSRLEMDPNGKSTRKNGEDIPRKPTEVNINSIAMHKRSWYFRHHSRSNNPAITKRDCGSVKKKDEIPYKTIHLTSQSCVSTQIT